MKSKKTLLITSVASLLMLSSIVVGSTFALFTSESQTNISVTAGKVNVNSTIDGLIGNSFTSLSVTEEGTITGTETGDILPVENVITYPNGGTATYDPSTGSILLDRVTPGDSLKFTITIRNDSNVNVKYRVKSTCEGSVQLFDALDIKYDGESSLNRDWKEWKADDTVRTKTINVSIAVPDLDNTYQGLSTKIIFSLEAVQGNAYTEDEVQSDLFMPDKPSVGTVTPEEGATNFYVETSDGLASASGPMKALNEGGKKVKYTVTPLNDKESITAHKLDPFINQKAAMYTVELSDEIGEFHGTTSALINYRFYVGKGLDGVTPYFSHEATGYGGVKLGVVIDRLDTRINGIYNFNYDKDTGFVSFRMFANAYDIIDKTNISFAFVKQVNKKENTSWYDSSAIELLISSVEDLKGFASLVNSGTSFAGKTVKLNTDLDLNGVSITPIGTKSNPFRGTFDGCEHTISNLVIDNTVDNVAGLFGYMDSTGGTTSTIKNLKLDAPMITASGTSIGTVLGDCYTGKVENISITNGFTSRTGASYLGGIVGHGAAEISNCYYQGRFLSKGDNGVSNFGGITGYSEGKLISKCYVDADFEAYSIPNGCGGIVGMAVGVNGLQIEDCYVTGRLIATNEYAKEASYGGNYNIGGIAGLGYSVNLGFMNNYVDADFYYKKYDAAGVTDELKTVHTGYIIGNCNGDYGGNEMFDLAKFIDNSWKDDVNEYDLSGYDGRVVEAKPRPEGKSPYYYHTITKATECKYTSGLTYEQFLELNK